MTTDESFEKWWADQFQYRVHSNPHVKEAARAAYRAASADADRLRDLVRRLRDGLTAEREALEYRDPTAEVEALLAEADEELKNA